MGQNPRKDLSAFQGSVGPQIWSVLSVSHRPRPGDTVITFCLLGACPVLPDFCSGDDKLGRNTCQWDLVKVLTGLAKYKSRVVFGSRAGPAHLPGKGGMMGWRRGLFQRHGHAEGGGVSCRHFFIPWLTCVYLGNNCPAASNPTRCCKKAGLCEIRGAASPGARKPQPWFRVSGREGEKPRQSQGGDPLHHSLP